jgi:regulator of replication initiation timing
VISLKNQVQHYQEVGGAKNIIKYIIEEHDKCLEVEDELVRKALGLKEES